LGDELDGVLSSSVDLGVAALAAEAADLGHRHSGDVVRLERVLDVVELVRFDDGGDELHRSDSSRSTVMEDIDDALSYGACHTPCTEMAPHGSSTWRTWSKK